MTIKTKTCLCLTAVGLLVSGCWLLDERTRSSPKDIVRGVPIGSNLVDLDRYLKKWNLEAGNVMQWIPSSETPPERSLQLRDDGELISTEYGTCIQKKLAHDYDLWGASAEERNNFTGEVFFYRDAWSYVVWRDSQWFIFQYNKGKLRKGTWGYLPS